MSNSYSSITNSPLHKGVTNVVKGVTEFIMSTSFPSLPSLYTPSNEAGSKRKIDDITVPKDDGNSTASSNSSNSNSNDDDVNVKEAV
mmetsp:Transcript_25956/g.29149  ORF Transcript_25956/g.29149 Transcript_25956/m.29149 type:complete len:87 (+) Transcript_25956:164-424(+)